MPETSRTPEYPSEHIPLYRRLCYPDEKTIEDLAQEIVSGLHAALGNREHWNILDVGIGPGWITSRVVKKLVEDGATVSVVGIDKCKPMRDECLKTFRNVFSSLRPHGDQSSGDGLIPEVWRDAETGFSLELYVEDFPSRTLRPWERQFDAGFLFLSLHQMTDTWRVALDKVTELLSMPGVVATLQLAGDQAGWNCHFNKIELLQNTAHDPGDQTRRLRFLGFLRDFQQICENLGWSNSRSMSISDLGPALEYLHHELGMRVLPTTKHQYQSRFSPREWLLGGGIDLKSKDFGNAGKTRLFTSFPMMEKGDDYLRQIGDALGKSGFSSEDDGDREFTSLNEATLHLMGRGMPDADSDLHHSVCSPRGCEHFGRSLWQAGDQEARYLRARFSELRVPEQELEMAYWANDLESLWGSGAVERPVCMMMLRWDLERDEWRRDTAVIVKAPEYAKGLARYFAGQRVFTENYSISNTVFRGFPELSAVRTVHGASEFDLKVRLHANGHVSHIEFHLPGSAMDLEALRRIPVDGLDDDKTLLRDSRRIPETYHFQNEDLEGYIKRLSFRFRELKPEAVYNGTMLQAFEEQAREKLGRLQQYTGREEWLLKSGKDLTNFLKTLLLSGICEGGSLCHLPSRDIMLRTNNSSTGDSLWAERSAGGVVMVLDKSNSGIDEDVISDCLNLRNRAAYLRQHQKRTIDLAVRAAEAAVISRNMSHNIGSHVLAGLSVQDLTKPDVILDLTSYLQQRMDFVARLATRWPAWREPMLFWSDLLRPFCQQKLLLSRLLADCGYGETAYQVFAKGKLAIYVRLQRNGPWWSLEYGPRGPGLMPHNHKEPFVDFHVAIPGGTVGKHAFYGFLENAMRNAAKHNPKQDCLNVYISVFRQPESASFKSTRRFTVEFHDSLTRQRQLSNGGSLFEQLSRGLKTELVGEDANLDPNGWGMQEMKTYAKYLNFQGRVQEAGSNELLTVCRTEPGDVFPEAQGISKDFLGLKFSVQESTIALIVSSAECCERQLMELSNGGVCLLRSPWGAHTQHLPTSDIQDVIQQQSPGLLAVEIPSAAGAQDGLAGWLSEQRERLPARVLLYSVSRIEIVSKLNDLRLDGRVQIVNGLAVDVTRGGAEGLVVALYGTRLKELATLRGFALPFHIVIGLSRDEPAELLRWDPVLSCLSEHGLNDFIKIHRILGTEETDGGCSFELPAGIFLSNVKLVVQDESDVAGSWLVFDNHGKFSGVLPDDAKRVFSQLVGHDQATGANNQTVFEHLFNPPEKVAGVLYTMQIIESGIMNVLVIDERVGEAFYMHTRVRDVNKVDRKTDKKAAWVSLMRAGVEVMPAIHLPHGRTIAMLNLPHGVTLEGMDAGLHVGPKCVEKLVMFNDGFRTREVRGALNGDTPPPYDVVVVHLQQLQNIERELNDGFKEFLVSLQSLATRILITSGRGAARTAPYTEYAFVEYSAIDQYLIRELSKVSLCNVISSATVDTSTG